MADRLTQLQEAVNQVREWGNRIIVLVFTIDLCIHFPYSWVITYVTVLEFYSRLRSSTHNRLGVSSHDSAIHTSSLYTGFIALH